MTTQPAALDIRDGALHVDDPFTLELACRVPLSTPTEIEATLDGARRAATAWARTTVAERISILQRFLAKMEDRKEEIARDLAAMMGKPVAQGRNEVAGMAFRARTMCELAEAALADVIVRPDDTSIDRRIRKAPLGVVLDLPAWNYPLLTAINVLAPAVLAGNAVIVKHSPRSPLAGMHLARAFREAGAPEGLVQSLDCDHATTEKLVGDARIDHVVFTGSVYGGHRIVAAAANRFLHVGLELGGNDPSYVAADCDLEKTVENIVDGAIYNAGQSCCAVERVYVHREVFDDFVALAEPLVRAYVLGDPRDATTTLGPIAQPRHTAELAALVADATSRGARLVAGGHARQVGGKGRFFEATLLADVAHHAALMRGESFGPILPVARVENDAEALACMNDSALGLTASIWTNDGERARRFADALECGTVFQNRSDHVDPWLPWTGWKDSGRGHSLSALGFDQVTKPKSIHLRRAL